MRGRDDLAAQAVRNLQHMQRLGSLYRVARQPEPDAQALRQQLVEAAHFAGPAAAALSTPDQCEQFVTRLRGLASLSLQLRDALQKGGPNAP